MIEVIVSLFLLAGGMLGALQMVLAAQNGLNSSRDRVRAIALVQSFIEERQTPYYRLGLGGEVRGRDVIEGVIREWEVLQAPMGLDGVTLRAAGRWTDQHGKPFRVEVILYRPSGVVP
ncbi:MAG TPA: hypothetical protein VIU33_04455 [Nitrospiria bacterium]